MAEHKPAVLWSPEALEDLDRLWDYYVRVAGRLTADKILREVAAAVAVIDDFPLAEHATKFGPVCVRWRRHPKQSSID